MGTLSGILGTPRLPAGSTAAGGADRIPDHPHRAVRGGRGAAAQPGRGDHRSGVRGGDGGQLGVQPADLGVAELGALLARTVDTLDGVVDVDQTGLLDAGQQILICQAVTRFLLSFCVARFALAIW